MSALRTDERAAPRSLAGWLVTTSEPAARQGDLDVLDPFAAIVVTDVGALVGHLGDPPDEPATSVPVKSRGEQQRLLERESDQGRGHPAR